jgi:hypothetical protein
MFSIFFLHLWQEVDGAPWSEEKRGGDFFLPSWLKHKFQVSISPLPTLLPTSHLPTSHQVLPSHPSAQNPPVFSPKRTGEKMSYAVAQNARDFLLLMPSMIKLFVIYNLLHILVYLLSLCLP